MRGVQCSIPGLDSNSVKVSIFGRKTLLLSLRGIKVSLSWGGEGYLKETVLGVMEVGYVACPEGASQESRIMPPLIIISGTVLPTAEEADR